LLNGRREEKEGGRREGRREERVQPSKYLFSQSAREKKGEGGRGRRVILPPSLLSYYHPLKERGWGKERGRGGVDITSFPEGKRGRRRGEVRRYSKAHARKREREGKESGNLIFLIPTQYGRGGGRVKEEGRTSRLSFILFWEGRKRGGERGGGRGRGLFSSTLHVRS